MYVCRFHRRTVEYLYSTTAGKFPFTKFGQSENGGHLFSLSTSTCVLAYVCRWCSTGMYAASSTRSVCRY